MAVQLFEHNAKAYQAAVKMMQQYGKAAIVHPTGTGKSYIAFKLIEDHPDAVIVGFPQVSISLRPSAKACCGKTRIFRCKTSAFTPTPS